MHFKPLHGKLNEYKTTEPLYMSLNKIPHKFRKFNSDSVTLQEIKEKQNNPEDQLCLTTL